MIKIKTWFAENKTPALFAGIFLLLSGICGWFSYQSWDDYTTALQAHASATEQMNRYAKQVPPVTEANLKKLGKTLDSDQAALNELLGALRRFRIPVFAGVEKAKSQDAPQLLQDALREEVTKLKVEANTTGVTLPQGFYLALEEYENRLPSPDDTIPLAKQLTVFDWISGMLISHRGLSIQEFSKANNSAAIQPAKTERKPLTPNGTSKLESPYNLTATLKISFRCDQGSLRGVLNSFSQSPYFLVIDSIQLQNSVTDPPRRDSTPQPAAPPSQEGQSPGQRIPVIVGREQINVILRVRILEFSEQLQKRPIAVSTTK